jgi:hypothetical protein
VLDEDQLTVELTELLHLPQEPEALPAARGTAG